MHNGECSEKLFDTVLLSVSKSHHSPLPGYSTTYLIPEGFLTTVRFSITSYSRRLYIQNGLPSTVFFKAMIRSYSKAD